jgi:hypothetical protein
LRRSLAAVARNGSSGALTTSDREELAMLRRENKVLKMERARQKSDGLLRQVRDETRRAIAKPPTWRAAFIANLSSKVMPAPS